MRRLRPAVCVLLGLVAVVSVAVGWLDDVPEITASEAVDAADAAFEAAGVIAEVDDKPAAAMYVSRSRRPVEVWTVRATVRSSLIVVSLARSGAQPVAIDDRTIDSSEYILSDIEYDAVARGVDDPALARVVRRNITLTLAAVLVVALSIALVLVTDPRSQESR